MKPVAIILLVICLACVAGTAYLYLDANLTVTDIRCTAYAAEDQAATFQELKKQLAPLNAKLDELEKQNEELRKELKKA